MGAALLFSGIAVLLAAGIVYARRARVQRRTAEMRALAGRMGWAFDPRPPLDAVPDRARFGLFSAGSPRVMRNHLSAQVDGQRVSVFDLEYGVPGSRAPHTRVQTVVHVHAPGMALPAFALRPEQGSDRLGELLGLRDVDVDADPAFSRAYLLRAADEPAVRALFDAEVRDFFHRHPGSCAQGQGADLLSWRAAKRAKVEEVDGMVQAALELAGRITRRAALPPYGGA